MVPDPSQLTNHSVFTDGKSLSWDRTLGEKGRSPSFPFHPWPVSCRAVQKSGVLGNRQSLHSGASPPPPPHCLHPFRMIEVLPELLSWFFSTYGKKKSDPMQRILTEWLQRSLSSLGTWQLIQQNVNPHSSRMKPTTLKSSFLTFCLGWAPLEGSCWGPPVPDFFPYMQKMPPRMLPSAPAIKFCCVPLDFKWAMNHYYILKKWKDFGCWAGHQLKL